MSRYRLLGLDLDGTLLDGRARIEPAALAALRQAAGQDVTVALVTGRSAGSTRHFARQVAAGTGRPVPWVACNGAGVYGAEGRLLAGRALPWGLVLPALDLLVSAGLLVSLYGPERVYLDQAMRHFRAFWGPRRPRAGQWLRVAATTWAFFRTNRMRVVADLRAWARAQAAAAGRQRPARITSDVPPAAAGVLKIFAVAPTPDRAPLRQAAGALAAALPSLHVTRSGHDNLEVTAPGTHKGWGLETLAQVYRVPRDQVMAVGDGFNDVEMLRYAGLGVAMGNAPAEVQAAAAWVAPPVEAGGVAAAVRRFVLEQA